jgi:hypothetical protein
MQGLLMLSTRCKLGGAKVKTLKSILSYALPINLGRVAFVEMLDGQMQKRLIQRV